MYIFSERGDQDLSKTVSIMFIRHFWTILQYPEVFRVFSGIEYVAWLMKNEIHITVPASQQQNKKLAKKYTKDPRIYWSQSSNTWSWLPFLISTVMFIFSQFAASANCERVFSRMVYMISSRKAGINADNADKRLTISNQIPRKRRLLDLCDERKIKEAKLFEI